MELHVGCGVPGVEAAGGALASGDLGGAGGAGGVGRARDAGLPVVDKVRVALAT